MGEPVRIAEVAEQLAQTVHPPCAIEYVGLRPGEKLHEELFGDAEQPEVSSHPLIRSVFVPPVSGDAVRAFPTTITHEAAAETLEQLCLGMDIDLASPRTIDLSRPPTLDDSTLSWQPSAGE